MSLKEKIKEWEKEQLVLFEELKENLGKKKFVFNSKGGRCFMRDDYDFKYQKCKDCHYLWNHLSNKSRIPVPGNSDKFFNIEKGKGENIFRLREDIKRGNIQFGEKEKKFYNDEFFAITNIDWYSTNDKLLNLAINLLILRLYSVRKKFPLYIDFVYFYRCTETNFLLYIEKDYLSTEEFLKNTTEKTVKSIFFQIILSLKFFSTLFFTHNELDHSKLRFSNKEFNIVYQSVKFISPFRCFIFPSKFSSISIYNSKKDWWGRFFYNGRESIPERLPFEDYLIEMNGSKSYYNSSTELDFVPSFLRENYINSRICFYRLGDNFSLFLDIRRNRGYVWALNSFDVITCFCSLFSLSHFSDFILKDEDLRRIWYGLWRREEAEKITKLLIGKNLLFNDVCKILKKFYIRFDALTYLFREISQLI